MLRLLQGDVGSGKTVVALLAMASVVESGRQGALMAPTEILARQHHERLAPLAARCGAFDGAADGPRKGRGARGRPRRHRIGRGEHRGRHACAVPGRVAFHDLGLAVVDEQHRFGVHQRLALPRKGEAVDVLVMTATPIPRSLVLSYFGDMDVSRAAREACRP